MSEYPVAPFRCIEYSFVSNSLAAFQFLYMHCCMHELRHTVRIRDITAAGRSDRLCLRQTLLIILSRRIFFDIFRPSYSMAANAVYTKHRRKKNRDRYRFKGTLHLYSSCSFLLRSVYQIRFIYEPLVKSVDLWWF